MHFDVEHSFLLQVKGVKHVSVAVFGTIQPLSNASSIATWTGENVISPRCRPSPRPSPSIQAPASTYRPTSPTGSRRRRASPSHSLSRSTRSSWSGPSRHKDQQATAAPASLAPADRRLGASRQGQGGVGPILDEAPAETKGLSERSDDGSVLRDWLSVLRRQRWIVLLAVSVVPLLAFAASQRQQRLYQASASVLLNEQNPTTAEALNLTSAPPSTPDRFAATQAKLARVGAVAKSAVRAPGFPIAPPPHYSRTRV